MLTVVVVHKHGDGMSGPGFFRLAGSLGHGTKKRGDVLDRGAGRGVRGVVHRPEGAPMTVRAGGTDGMQEAET